MLRNSILKQYHFAYLAAAAVEWMPGSAPALEPELELEPAPAEHELAFAGAGNWLVRPYLLHWLHLQNFPLRQQVQLQSFQSVPFRSPWLLHLLVAPWRVGQAVEPQLAELAAVDPS